MNNIDFKSQDFNSLMLDGEFEQKVKNFLEEWLSHAETVKVQTSGSTGIPKVFEVEKNRMRNSAKMTCDFLGLKQENTALLCLPVEYISGKMMVVRAMERKLKLFIENPSVKPLQNLDFNVDFCAMTPLQVENSLEKLHFIKNLIIGGAAVSENLKLKIKSVIKSAEVRIFETYGMSETLSHIALKQIFPAEELWFTVFEDVEISTDSRGCLEIFAPKLNQEKLQTNDLVEIKNEKQFRFLGRADNVINSGGSKIFPEELEALIKKSISNEIVFVGIPDEILGQKLIMVVEGNLTEIENELLSQISYQKSFHRPKEIIFVEEIPRTPNGKVDRRKLLSQILNR